MNNANNNNNNNNKNLRDKLRDLDQAELDQQLANDLYQEALDQQLANDKDRAELEQQLANDKDLPKEKEPIFCELGAEEKTEFKNSDIIPPHKIILDIKKTLPLNKLFGYQPFG